MDKKKFEETLEIMNDRFPNEYYDSRIREKMAEIGKEIDDQTLQAVLLERRKGRKKSWLGVIMEFLFGWI